MGSKEQIVNTAISLIYMLEDYGDDELCDYIVNAIFHNDLISLYDLEDTIEE
jgi:hypothetical protein